MTLFDPTGKNVYPEPRAPPLPGRSRTTTIGPVGSRALSRTGVRHGTTGGWVGVSLSEFQCPDVARRKLGHRGCVRKFLVVGYGSKTVKERPGHGSSSCWERCPSRRGVRSGNFSDHSTVRSGTRASDHRAQSSAATVGTATTRTESSD